MDPSPLPTHLDYRGRRVLLKYHRLQTGGGRHPPNALSALKEVLERGAEAIEFDVGITLDGVYILLHDPNLERETTGVGPVRLTTHTELKRVRLRNSNESVPTLGEVVRLLRDVNRPLKVQVDLKETGPLSPEEARWLEGTLEPLLDHPKLQLVVGSHADWNLRMLREAAPDLTLGFDPAFYLDAPIGDFLRLPVRVNAYGYLDDHPLGFRRIWPVTQYLKDRLESLGYLVPGVKEFYLRKEFVLQSLDDGFNPIEFLHQLLPGVTVDVWTLDAHEEDAREKLLRILLAGTDQITTNTPMQLAALFFSHVQ